MTLRHIVSWKFNGETREQRETQIAEAVALIEPLRESVPSVRALSLHRNELFDGANYDLTLIADFDDADGLAEYASHPTHLPAIDFMKTVTAARAASDFTV
ncbi:MAG: Dabb family protein [Leucobacter sp.]